MKIDIGNLKDNRTYDIHLDEKVSPIKEMDFEKPFQIIADFELTKNGNKILLDGNLEANTVTDCHICAEEFALQINTDFKLLILNTNSEEQDPDDFDVKIVSFEDKIIDIEKEIIDEVITEFPMVFRCSRKSCEIKLTDETEDENIDPRWAKLQSLLPDSK
ncbi:MAG: hypothetical protein DWQ06_10905 [Calditrichaeota bacterium]|nr:MAG: hypothetical protein DWQ06_10905 [Calditrichota bacterium]